MIPETGERIGQGEAHRADRLVRRALIEGDREQWAEKRNRKRGLPFPEDDQGQRSRRHERERRRRLGDVLPRDGEERPARIRGKHRADQGKVDDPVVDEPAEHDLRDEDPDRVAVDVLHR